jgi:deoxyribodipyrimidine photo-lyase
VDWRVGAEWFEMHLVDYDTCSKYVLPYFSLKSRADSSWGNWQYQAGVGNDPRSSRQFNPIKQAADYDAEGKYVRLWIPELKDVDDMYLQTPWCKSSSLTSLDLGEQG